MVTYPDTSFLFSLYVQEQTSSFAKLFMSRRTAALPFTPFHRLELRTSLRLRAFQGLIDRANLGWALQQSEDDLAAGIFEHAPINWQRTLREAERLAAAHLVDVGARTGDLLHVSSAVVLGATEFLTFDQRQTALARRAGLKVRTWQNIP